MAYTEIKDFKQGLDTRRPAIVGEPGTLMECVNAHITRGGDVESAKKFVPNFTLPEDTFGFHTGDNRIFVFGSIDPPTNLPGYIVYQQLEHPDEEDMTDLLFAENYDGKVYAIAEYADGAVFHFYDGVHVTDWDAKAEDIADDSSVAIYLADKVDASSAFLANAAGSSVIITAAVPGTSFTIAEAATGTGDITLTQLQANQVAVAEERAEASFQIMSGIADPANKIISIRAGTTDLILEEIPFVLDTTSTALQCVISINQGTDEHGYSAVSVGSTVTIRAPVGDGAAANGTLMLVSTEGVLVVDNIVNFADGVTAVEAKPQIEEAVIGGTFDVANTYTLTLNGTDYQITGLASGMSRIAKTFSSKMYTGVRALAIFSAIDDPTAVTTGTGIGLINISSKNQGSQRLTAFGIYQNLLAVFSRRTVQIWAMDPDPGNNIFKQLLEYTGTRSPKAVIGYGASDLMYLSDTGIRSLRARDSSNAAFADDIGTRIDNEVIEFMATLTDTEIQGATAIVDPTDGRAWIALKNRIYVFSYFPGSKVSAWSYYSPGFDIEGMAVANNRIYVRSGNAVYLYGGESGNVYPAENEIEVRVRLPFIDAERIAGEKDIKGVDVICSGEWTVSLLVDPRDENLTTTPIKVTESTVLLGRIPIGAETTHFAPLLTSTKGGKLVLSSVVVHFEDTETM
jgi:hypothetical protein